MALTHIAPLTNRALLRLDGADTKEFLQNLVSNDLELLSPDKAIYSALLTPQGKFLHDFFIIEWDGSVFLDCLKERHADLIRRLTMYKLRADITLTDVTDSFSTYAIYKSEPKGFPSNLGEAEYDKTYVLYADPRLSALGYRIIEAKGADRVDNLPDTILNDFNDYTAHRLALGVPEGGTDIVPEKNFLLEANVEELNGVSFSKGCYVGQELTARTKYRAKIKKRLFSFQYEGDIAIGDSIKVGDREIAVVAAFQAPHGLALTRLKEWGNLDAQTAELTPSGITLTKPGYVILPETEN